MHAATLNRCRSLTDQNNSTRFGSGGTRNRMCHCH
jgi:hypothetical protein